MKKLKLDFQQLNAEVLTRSQLKKVLGGVSGSTSCPTGEVHVRVHLTVEVIQDA